MIMVGKIMQREGAKLLRVEKRVIMGQKIQASKRRSSKIFGMSMQKFRGGGKLKIRPGRQTL